MRLMGFIEKHSEGFTEIRTKKMEFSGRKVELDEKQKEDFDSNLSKVFSELIMSLSKCRNYSQF